MALPCAPAPWEAFGAKEPLKVRRIPYLESSPHFRKTISSFFEDQRVKTRDNLLYTRIQRASSPRAPSRFVARCLFFMLEDSKSSAMNSDRVPITSPEEITQERPPKGCSDTEHARDRKPLLPANQSHKKPPPLARYTGRGTIPLPPRRTTPPRV